jgi:hypothetical protein
MDARETPVSLDEVVGWAVDQGAFLPPDLPCSRDDAIEITRWFYSQLRAMVMEAVDFSVLEGGFDSTIQDPDYLSEICSDSGIAIPRP